MKYNQFLKNKTFSDLSAGFQYPESALNQTLFDYQRAIVAWALARGRAAIFADTGLGKTLEIIAALCYRWEKDPDRPAIVLTTKSATSQWVVEFGKFTTGVKAFSCHGTPTKRKKIYKEFLAAEGPKVLVMGYRTAEAGR